MASLNILNEQFLDAARDGNLTMVRSTLKRGATLGYNNHSALKGSVANKHLNVIFFLLKAGRSHYAEMAAILAAKQGDIEIVTALVEKYGFAKKMGHAIAEAATHGHRKVVHYLLGELKDTTLQGLQKNEALYHAASFGHAILVNEMILAGADINCDDCAAFASAIANDHLSAVKMFVSHGANISIGLARAKKGSGIHEWLFMVDHSKKEKLELQKEKVPSPSMATKRL